MAAVSLGNFPVLLQLELDVIEFLFRKYAGFVKRSFCVYKQVYSDGSQTFWIDYPTDLNQEDMPDLIENLVKEVENLSLKEILELHMKDDTF